MKTVSNVLLLAGLLTAATPALAWYHNDGYQNSYHDSYRDNYHDGYHGDYNNGYGGHGYSGGYDRQRNGYGAAQEENQTFPLADALPNPQLTPGSIDPRVTQANLNETICRPGGYTRSVRPPESYTEPLKRQLIRRYGYSDYRLGAYELDHLVSLELGGAPADPHNLWPEPHNVVGGWGSYAKDHLENRLHELVCAGQLPLATAQYDIAHDWVTTYKQYMGPTPDNTPPQEWHTQRYSRHSWR